MEGLGKLCRLFGAVSRVCEMRLCVYLLLSDVNARVAETKAADCANE